MLRTSEHTFSNREIVDSPDHVIATLSKIGVELREREKFMMMQFHHLIMMGFSSEQSYRIMEVGNISQSFKAARWVVEVVIPANKNTAEARYLVNNLLQLVIGTGRHAYDMRSIKRLAHDWGSPLPEYKKRKDALVPFFKSAICTLQAIESQWHMERKFGRRARAVPLS